ncbi:MAG: hypothetical protein Q7J13_05315 [Brevundimonas sp.]|uniref:hypothetical protein n=1 Tax=Brevundimonas sp. TaxID=1871086 RepID=UPI002726EEEA|nr:hypothetical protein [Brevundimonas sp.]MDO9587335.1 hypothetical protein [Brevundimonas sp.]
MSIRSVTLSGAVVVAAAIAGVATSQTQPPSPVAATQVDLPRSSTDSAALGQARQDPLAARLRGVLGQDPASARVLAVADASPVPVLAPADPALLRTARIFTGDRHYMLVVQRGGDVIEIYGATKAFRSPLSEASPQPPPPAAPPTAAAPTVNRPTTTAAGGAQGPGIRAARIPSTAARAAAQAQTRGLTNLRTERTEYGVDVTFNRFGAAYNVSFICDGPGAAGCTEPEAVTFASTLQLIGGGLS